MALGDNIKRLREEHSLTQQQLADKLYVSRQTVCRWENGSRCPDLIMAKKLAAELGISLDELISDEDLKEVTKNDFPFHSDIVKSRKELEEKRKPDYGVYSACGRNISCCYDSVPGSAGNPCPGMGDPVCPVRGGCRICGQIPHIPAAGPVILRGRL